MAYSIHKKPWILVWFCSLFFLRSPLFLFLLQFSRFYFQYGTVKAKNISKFQKKACLFILVAKNTTEQEFYKNFNKIYLLEKILVSDSEVQWSCRDLGEGH